MRGVPNLVGRSEELLSRGDLRAQPSWIILAAVFGAALAHWQVWGRAAAGDGGGVGSVGAEPAALWPWLYHLLNSLPNAGDGALGAAFALSLLVMLAALTGLLARRLGLGGLASAVASLCVAWAPASGAALLDAAGLGTLLATLCWLGVLVCEEKTGRRSGLKLAAQLVLAVAALAFSQGAFVLLLPTWPLWAFLRSSRVSPRIRWIATASCLVLLAAGLLLMRHLPAMGYGYRFLEGLGAFDPEHPEPAPFLVASLLAPLGFGAELPFLTPTRWLPLFSLLIAAGLVFLWLLVPTPATRERQPALRFGSLCLLAGCASAWLVGTTTAASAIALASTLPAVVGLALVVAAVLQPNASRRSGAAAGSAVLATGRAVAVLLMAVALIQTQRLEVRSERQWIEYANDVDPAFVLAAVERSERLQREQGRVAPEAIRNLILRAPLSMLPHSLETELGLRVMRDLEHEQGAVVALSWIEEWSGSRERRPVHAVVLAQALRLAVIAGEVENALQFLELGRAASPGSEYASEAARALLEALSARADEVAVVDRLLPVVEELLAEASEADGDRGVDALLTLVGLRSGQQRFVAAIRAAEDAARRAPRDPRPLLAQARVYLDCQQRDAGLRMVQEALVLDRDHPGVLFLQGRMWTTLPQFAQRGAETMIDAYLSAPERAGSLGEVIAGLRLASESLRSSGRVEEAVQVLDSAAERLPVRKELRLERARAAKAQKQWAHARGLLEELLEDHPERDVVRVELVELLRDEGMLLLFAKKTERALERFERAIALQAPGVALEGMQAVVDSHRAPSHPAVEDVERARSAFEEGVRAYQERNPEAAYQAFERSLQWMGSNPLAHLNLGRLDCEAERWGPAEAHLLAAIQGGDRVRVDVEHAYLLLARVLEGDGRNDEIKALVERYRERHPVGAYLEQIEALGGGG